MEFIDLVIYIILALCLLGISFCIYMSIRNNVVYEARLRFNDYFHYEDHNGYAAGKRFHEALPSYDEMLWKFWVWPLSKFYPAYRNRNK